VFAGFTCKRNLRFCPGGREAVAIADISPIFCDQPSQRPSAASPGSLPRPRAPGMRNICGRPARSPSWAARSRRSWPVMLWRLRQTTRARTILIRLLAGVLLRARLFWICLLRQSRCLKSSDPAASPAGPPPKLTRLEGGVHGTSYRSRGLHRRSGDLQPQSQNRYPRLIGDVPDPPQPTSQLDPPGRQTRLSHGGRVRPDGRRSR